MDIVMAIVHTHLLYGHQLDPTSTANFPNTPDNRWLSIKEYDVLRKLNPQYPVFDYSSKHAALADYKQSGVELFINVQFFKEKNLIPADFIDMPSLIKQQIMKTTNKDVLAVIKVLLDKKIDLAHKIYTLDDKDNIKLNKILSAQCDLEM